MKIKVPVVIVCLVLLASVTALGDTRTRQKSASAAPRAMAYDATRETILQGTVLSYTERSPLPPIGAHVLLQTASGTVDVHLGPASYLRANHLAFAPGEAVGFVGTLSRANKNAVFLARIAQKGSQSLTIRSPRGFLLATSAGRASSRSNPQSAQQGGPR